MKNTLTHKLLALCISTLMVAALIVPLSIVAADETLTEDKIWFGDEFTGTTVSNSSTGSTIWNNLYPSKSGVIVDPADSGNKVANIYSDIAAATPEATISKGYMGFGGPAVLSFRMYLPDAPVQPVIVKYAPASSASKNVQILTFTYNSATNDYTFAIGASNPTSIGKVKRGEWFKINLSILPGAGATLDTKWAASSVTATVSGNIKDMSDISKDAITANMPITIPYVESTWGKLRYDITISLKEASKTTAAGFYLDNVKFYEPGPFNVGSINTEAYTDLAKNIKVDGNITLNFNHDIDASTFSTDMIKVLKNGSQDTSITNIAFDPSKPNVVILNFANNALDYYSNYTVMLNSGIKDITGRSIDQGSGVVSFATLGAQNQMPPVMTRTVPPNGGYIMPDEYNTGHLSDFSDLVDIATKYPELSGSGTKKLTEDIAKKYGRVFEGFKMDTGLIQVLADNVTIRDFYMYGTSYYVVQNLASNLLLEDGSITGTQSCAVTGDNITLRRLHIYDVGADHLKPSTNWTVESCYLHDGGGGSHLSHADGMQITGSDNVLTHNIRVIGNRVDMPPLPLKHLSNTPMFCSLEKGVATNIEISYNWFNGGGYTSYVQNGNGNVPMSNVFYTHNLWGAGNRYGHLSSRIEPAADKDKILTQEGNIALDSADIPCVGSVVYKNNDGERIYNLADTGDKLTVMANIANYTLRAQDIVMVAELLNGSGEVASKTPLTTQIPRYIPTSEYMVPSNLEQLILPNESGIDTAYDNIKVYPDLPRNIEKEIVLTGLPANRAGYSLRVSVYTKDENGALLRRDILEGEAGGTDPESSITLNHTSYTLSENYTSGLIKVSIDGVPVTEGFTVESSDSGIVRWEKGKVITGNKGTATLTFTNTADNTTAVFTATVEPNIDVVDLVVTHGTGTYTAGGTGVDGTIDIQADAGVDYISFKTVPATQAAVELLGINDPDVYVTAANHIMLLNKPATIKSFKIKMTYNGESKTYAVTVRLTGNTVGGVESLKTERIANATNKIIAISGGQTQIDLVAESGVLHPMTGLPTTQSSVAFTSNLGLNTVWDIDGGWSAPTGTVCTSLSNPHISFNSKNGFLTVKNPLSRNASFEISINGVKYTVNVDFGNTSLKYLITQRVPGTASPKASLVPANNEITFESSSYSIAFTSNLSTTALWSCTELGGDITLPAGDDRSATYYNPVNGYVSILRPEVGLQSVFNYTAKINGVTIPLKVTVNWTAKDY